jgi:hypothetical protein
VLVKLEREFGAALTKGITERQEKIRTRLAGVNDAAELDRLVGELAARPRRPDPLREPDADGTGHLAAELSSLARAWNTGNTAQLQSDLAGGNTSRHPFLKELADLRQRIERDVLSRIVRAPELKSPPLSEKPLDVALESFSNDLANSGDWRRLYRLIELTASMQMPRGGLSSEEALAALRSFFAAQNFEAAEQWKEAVQAYKSVLQSASERAPIKAAAERLKQLTKEHPDAANAMAQTR